MDRTARSLVILARRVMEGRSMEAYEHGFDLTSFRSPSSFQRVLMAAGINPNQEPQRGHLGEFIWKGSGVTIVTGNNPITGEYMQAGQRRPEPGYASYIGLDGDEKKVKAIVELIKKTSEWGEESVGSRDFI